MSSQFEEIKNLHLLYTAVSRYSRNHSIKEVALGRNMLYIRTSDNLVVAKIHHYNKTQQYLIHKDLMPLAKDISFDIFENLSAYRTKLRGRK